MILLRRLPLAFLGGVAGLALAAVLARTLLASIPAEGQPLLINASPDSRILGFTTALTFVRRIVFALVPALREPARPVDDAEG